MDSMFEGCVVLGPEGRHEGGEAVEVEKDDEDSQSPILELIEDHGVDCQEDEDKHGDMEGGMDELLVGVGRHCCHCGSVIIMSGL